MAPRILSILALFFLVYVSLLCVIEILGFGFEVAVCENREIYSIPSPNKELRAVVFVRSCIPTDLFDPNRDMHVSIVRENSGLKDLEGNIYITRSVTSPELFASSVRWVSDELLLIDQPPSGYYNYNVRKSKKKWGLLNSVSIKYRGNDI